MTVRLANIDSGNFTEDVYKFCRRRPNVFRPIKGHDQLSGVPYYMAKVERTLHTGRAKMAGVRLWHVDSSYAKDELARMIDSQESLYHVYEGIEDWYFTQMAAEHKIVIRNKTTGREKLEWRPVSMGAQNHWLDASAYAYMAANMIGAHRMTGDHATPMVRLPTPHQPKRSGKLKMTLGSRFGGIGGFKKV